uniref:Protein N-terminal glutamine amidohydrolase n=1 Tax=Clandestinovirus TaxID=2831644 RepID=A0A8F8KLD3_9VIRU|nr:glutamine amidohydrolase [Clandestinovirus]
MASTCNQSIVTTLKTKYRWCDENAYRLAAKLPEGSKCYVLFISNPERKVAMYYQASDLPQTEQDFTDAAKKGIVWDYHVVVICWCKDGWVVYDSSTTLGWAVPLFEWMNRTFGNTKYPKPMFKIIPREQYVRDYKSNRTDLEGRQIPAKNWPAWPAINQTPGKSESNLLEYVTMTGNPPPKGRVVELQGLKQFFYPLE